jgi:hypothetical protein
MALYKLYLYVHAKRRKFKLSAIILSREKAIHITILVLVSKKVNNKIVRSILLGWCSCWFLGSRIDAVD